MTKIRVYVGTTEGPVAIERIIREAAPNSAMCIGRSTREATASTGYEAFVKQPSGVIERELGPYSPGAFRLDVSADIGDGDSWQLGVFMAHALAAEGRLAEYHEDADAALWLTGEVANDLEVKPVGHVPDKLRASHAEFEALASRGTPVTLIVAKANREYLEQAKLSSAITWVAVSRIDEALQAAGLSGKGARGGGGERKAAIAGSPSPDASRVRSGARRWRYAVAAVMILAAGAASYPFAERLWDSTPSEGAPKPTPSAVTKLDAPTKPTAAVPNKPASRSATTDGAADASTPAEDGTGTVEGVGHEASRPATGKTPPTATISLPVPETAPDSHPETPSGSVAMPNSDAVPSRQTVSAPEPATSAVAAPPRPVIRLVIRERRAPAGATCAAVHFGRVAAATTEVPRLGPDRFAPSRHDGLCGLEFAIVISGPPAYVAAFTTMASGRFRDAGRAPEALAGGSPLEGETSWAVDVARRLRAPIDYRLVAIVSDRPVTEIGARLRAQANPVVAARGLSAGVTVHHARHRVDP